MHTGLRLTRRPLHVIAPADCPACAPRPAPAPAVLAGVVAGGVAICSGCAAALLVGPDRTLHPVDAGAVFGLVLDGTWEDVEMIQRVLLRRLELAGL